MIQSMTGFGKATVGLPDRAIKTEIRTLNSKNLDLTVKLPGLYREMENPIRTMINNALHRGKVDIVITLECSTDSTAYSINSSLLEYYFKQIKQTAHNLDVQISDNFLPDLLKLPEVLKPQVEEMGQQEKEAIEKSVQQALDQVIDFRTSEGKHMYDDIMNRQLVLRQLLEAIEPFESLRIENIRDRILRSLESISVDVKSDQNRFEQEIIFYLEKLDITEEKVRLAKHLDYFNETLNAEEPGGKKLGFIAQEIGREINTIGSKANDASIQKIVVQMKDELEKIKEQLMNVL
ncbi:MAG: YicC/YloC family endoribonuclease [Bacteroidota bacterium]